MKKRITLLGILFLAGSISIWAQFTFLGAGAGYGSKIEQPGFHAYGVYSVNDQIDLVPNITYFLPREIERESLQPGENEQEFATEWWNINFDGHWNPIEEEWYMLYGLMGLNYSNVRWEKKYEINSREFDEVRTNGNLGLNIGAGAQLKLSEKIAPFIQGKYTLGEHGQLVLSGGILFRIAPDREPIVEE